MACTGAGALALTGPATPATGRRGRGPAAPTVNPRTITDFEDVTSIPFVFARHPIYTEAHIHMNTIYSDALFRTAVKSPFYCFLYTKLMYCFYTNPTLDPLK